MLLQSFYAHSGARLDKSDWQTLPNHLNAVAQLAANNAAPFSGQAMAHVAGLLHDLGKYSAEFQARLEGSPQRADHATAGAKVAAEKYDKLGSLIAFVIAGHHAGLANGVDEGDSRSTLNDRLALEMGGDRLPKISPVWMQQITLPLNVEYPKIMPDAAIGYGFQLATLTRMLFSCLIDADRTDTQNFSFLIEGKSPISKDYPSVINLRANFNSHLAKLEASATPSALNTLRARILAHSRAEANRAKGLFSMTVPTGGGKTFASMAFALDHALQHGQRRIIYVIPFTSIIEQNAKVFKEAFGDLSSGVVEHHSSFDRELSIKRVAPNIRANFSDKLRIAMESWDAPIIVTTAVQFFESLFSDRPSQCRKLHNIAGSVIVLDEAQTLPLKLLRPIMAIIKELARNYNCSVVLCTATQPALRKDKGFVNGFENVREIAPDPAVLFKELKRAKIESIGPQSDEELVRHLSLHKQVLMIVNNRRHARSLYGAIQAEPGAFHLSTLMIAKHRTAVLNEVRKKLKSGMACKLISTSLVEAGVDVDFPRVFRAEAGLDSIAQAAGRCNREGLNALDASIVSVFQSPDWPSPPELVQLVGNMRTVLRNNVGDVLAPEAIQLYFNHVYHGKTSGTADELDSKRLLQMHRNHQSALTFPFQNIAKAFRMIESHLFPVIVPLTGEVETLLQDLRFADKVGGIARKLQPYLIQIPKNGFEALKKCGAIAAIAPEKFGDQFWFLEKMDLYSAEAGLSWDEPEFTKAEGTVF